MFPVLCDFHTLIFTEFYRFGLKESYLKLRVGICDVSVVVPAGGDAVEQHLLSSCVVVIKEL